MKYIYGRTNNKNWKPSSKDKNAGAGHYGTCCAELDIWEANLYST
jgi:cellulose 1,4-beta-cellobiosidase